MAGASADRTTTESTLARMPIAGRFKVNADVKMLLPVSSFRWVAIFLLFQIEKSDWSVLASKIKEWC